VFTSLFNWGYISLPLKGGDIPVNSNTRRTPNGLVQPVLFVVPTTLKLANEFVSAWHRHHKKARGCRFCLAAVDERGGVHGVAIVGRPVARLAGDPQHVAEVTRLATAGRKNACSILYAAAARAAKQMGFWKIQTYLLDTEPGISLKASGWVLENVSRGGNWALGNRADRRTDQPQGPKQRWAKTLNPKRPLIKNGRQPTQEERYQDS